MKTIEELNAEIQRRGNEIDAAKDELRALCRERDALAEAGEAEQALAKLDPKTRAKVIARAGGIPSEEKHGRIGGR